MYFVHFSEFVLDKCSNKNNLFLEHDVNPLYEFFEIIKQTKNKYFDNRKVLFTRDMLPKLIEPFYYYSDKYDNQYLLTNILNKIERLL